MLNKIYNFSERLLNYSRTLRSRYFDKPARFLIKLGISADMLTFLSLICGITAFIYFNNHWYFVLFGILHLIFDSMDGAVARITGPTKFGTNFDTAADSIVAVLLLLNVPFGIPVAVVYALQIVLFLVSKRKSPVLFARTPLLVMFFFKLYFIGIATVAVIAFAGIVLQIYHLTTLRPKI